MDIKITINKPINPSFEPLWFNSQEYSQKQSCDSEMLFSYEEGKKQIFIRFYGNLSGKEWRSPCRAPFGGLSFSSEVDLQTLYAFVKEITKEAKARGVGKIKITAPPECYDLVKADLIDEVLIHAGFSISITELNYHIDVGTENFESVIHESEKRRLKKCINAGFKFELEKNPDFAVLHKLISKCRLRKGHPLSMNKDDFEKMFLNFPERYHAFVVKDQLKIIATAIGVRVSDAILYNFLPADHDDYQSYSPMVFLNNGIYEYCRMMDYAIFDLGIATSGGIRNEGLIKFKEHIGGVLSHKYSYELLID